MMFLKNILFYVYDMYCILIYLHSHGIPLQ